VFTDAGTVFRVDAREPTKGAAGLALLAAAPQGTAVVAVGDFRGPEGAFLAWKVLAGSAVPGGSLDMARGVVVRRSGDVLTVRGAALDREEGSLTLHDEYNVTVGAGTKVSRQLDD
jgi:hypothetical protein